jgi:hypothetical protein
VLHRRIASATRTHAATSYAARHRVADLRIERVVAEHCGELPDPLQVSCSMRSGSTMLRLILDSHPAIAIGPETRFMNAVKATGTFPASRPDQEHRAVTGGGCHRAPPDPARRLRTWLRTGLVRTRRYGPVALIFRCRVEFWWYTPTRGIA